MLININRNKSNETYEVTAHNGRSATLHFHEQSGVFFFYELDEKTTDIQDAEFVMSVLSRLRKQGDVFVSDDFDQPTFILKRALKTRGAS